MGEGGRAEAAAGGLWGVTQVPGSPVAGLAAEERVAEASLVAQKVGAMVGVAMEEARVGAVTVVWRATEVGAQEAAGSASSATMAAEEQWVVAAVRKEVAAVVTLVAAEVAAGQVGVRVVTAAEVETVAMAETKAETAPCLGCHHNCQCLQPG